MLALPSKNALHSLFKEARVSRYDKGCWTGNIERTAATALGGQASTFPEDHFLTNFGNGPNTVSESWDKMASNWDKNGVKLGQKWRQVGTKWRQVGTKMASNWDKNGVKLWQNGVKLGQNGVNLGKMASVLGRELRELLSAYYLCAKANSPSFSHQNSVRLSEFSSPK